MWWAPGEMASGEREVISGIVTSVEVKYGGPADYQITMKGATLLLYLSKADICSRMHTNARIQTYLYIC